MGNHCMPITKGTWARSQRPANCFAICLLLFVSTKSNALDQLEYMMHPNALALGFTLKLDSKHQNACLPWTLRIPPHRITPVGFLLTIGPNPTSDPYTLRYTTPPGPFVFSLFLFLCFLRIFSLTLF